MATKLTFVRSRPHHHHSVDFWLNLTTLSKPTKQQVFLLSNTGELINSVILSDLSNKFIGKLSELKLLFSITLILSGATSSKRESKG